MIPNLPVHQNHNHIQEDSRKSMDRCLGPNQSKDHSLDQMVLNRSCMKGQEDRNCKIVRLLKVN